jgi:hypothetical protein
VVLQVLVGPRGVLDYVDHLVPVVLRDVLVLVVLEVHLVHLVLLDYAVLLVLLVHKDLKAPKVQLVQWVQLV